MNTTFWRRSRTHPPGNPAAALGLCLVLAAGCGNAGSPAADARPAAGGAVVVPAADDLPEVLATVGEDAIRLADLPATATQELTKLQNTYRQQRYAVIDEALNAAISDRLLAAEAEQRGTTTAELVAAESGTVLDPSDAEIEAWYAENQGRLAGRSLDELRDQIRDYLRESQAEAREEALHARLREKYGVTVNLEPYRVSLDNEGSPAYGNEDSKVTLVEFSDFECPFCGRFFPTLKRLEQEYGDRVRIVYRQFPISSLHPGAFKAAEASLCAAEHGEFWAYHDMLFQEQDRLAVRDLKEKAGRLGLDQAEFDTCLDTGRYVEQVQNDLAAGRAAGVTGTPALFVNGIPIPGGAVAYEVVAEALDEELARVGS